MGQFVRSRNVMPLPLLYRALVVVVVVVVEFGLYRQALSQQCVDPTAGFTQVPLESSDFEIQKPYDVPLGDRYSFIHGVRKLWVYSTDKPHTPTSRTKPRTEIRICGHDYSSGVRQFEAYGYIPSGTTGVSIMQIFGASQHASTLMLRVYNGSLRYYQSQIVEPNIYNRWFRLNVIHDVNVRRVRVFIDGVVKLDVNDRGGSSHYFKCGVYAQNDESNYMESRWRGIKLFRRG